MNLWGAKDVLCSKDCGHLIRDEWLEASEEMIGIGRKQHHRSARDPPSSFTDLQGRKRRCDHEFFALE
jgi:hypothetical protein